MPRLGRRPAPDARDRGYLLRRLLPAAPVLPSRKTWRIAAAALDQGVTSTCVGHAWRNFLRCAPLRTERSGPSAFDLYRRAVTLDPWKGNDDEARLPDGDPAMDDGTSVRAGAQALVGYSRLRSYTWAFELAPALEWVLTRGPLVLGTDWYSSLSRPSAEGIARITPAARSLGGHAYLCRGIDLRRALARCSNSWGDGWGLSGDFWLPLGDLERLIREDGECCAAIETALRARVA